MNGRELLFAAAVVSLMGVVVGMTGEPAAAAAPTPPDVALTDVTLLDVALGLDVPYAREPRPGLLTAGQLTREQMAQLAATGVARFLSLRPVDESGAGWEEQAAVELGVEFVRIPVASAADVNGANALLLARALAEGDGPVALYCGSSNRVGALLGLQLFSLEHKSAEEALAFAQASGITSLEPRLRELLAQRELPAQAELPAQPEP